MNKGDIVINNHAGENNPYRRLMYIGSYGCEYRAMACDGTILSIIGRDALSCVGHMKEYDDFVKALRQLKDGEKDENMGKTT